MVPTVPKRRQVEPLPAGPTQWLRPLLSTPDLSLLEVAGLDGYFFLRYMKFMLVICLAGCALLWVVLFPVYATGPAQQTGLNIISIANISGSSGRFYAPILLGWLWIGFVCYGIFREYQHYLSVRQEYMTAKAHAQLPQARTVLITQIPESHRSVEALDAAFNGFSGGIEKIQLNRDLATLDDKVSERQKIALKLEAAQTKLIKLASKNEFNRKKEADKSGGEQLRAIDHENLAEGAAKYVPEKKRPSHKLGALGLFGKKVDTIDWCESELARLTPEIDSAQANPEQFKLMNSAFIQFKTQAAAQACAQAVAHGKAGAMAPRYTEVSPHDVIWSNMNLTWQSRWVKSSLVTAFIAALIIFWAIPVAFVGTLSNITYLTEKVKFLRFINNCPPVLLGLITAYLPTILLAVLMALLPIILRQAAKISGIPTFSGVEYTVSNYYFTFLVVQVFLVVTVVSSAASSVVAIINDPTSAPSLLARQLPTASNFYISYILLQGLALSAGALAQVVGLILYHLLGKILDSTPRKKFNRFNSLSSVSFGTVYPVYSFLATITLTYSLIAPLILIFSAFTFAVFYVAFKYNFMFVYQLNYSTMGLLYPRALQQTMTGLYLLEVCMIGLVAVGKSYGSIVLMVIALIATILFHITLNRAFGPLLEFIPSTIASNEEFSGGEYTHAAMDLSKPVLWIPSDDLVTSHEAQKTHVITGLQVQTDGASVRDGTLTWDGKTRPADYVHLDPEL